jgi:SSS family solute:Na+ symporter
LDAWIVVVGISVAYLAASLAVGILPGRKASGTAAGYVAGDRTLGLLVMYFITGATIFSSFAFLGAPGWAYGRGAAAFYILGYGTLGFLPFYFLGPRAARLGRRYGFVTQGEMVGARYGSRLTSRLIAGLMAAISVAAFIPYLALQMKGAGYVLGAVTEGRLPEWAGAAIVYAVVLVYVLRSGVLGVGWTNTFQGMFMMLLAWGLGLYLPYRLYGGVEAMFRGIAEVRPEHLVPPGLTTAGDPWSWGGYSSAVIMSMIGFAVWPHLFMKAFTARDEATLRRTVVLYPTFQIFLVPLFLIGFAGVLFHGSPERNDQILPYMLMNMEIPAVLVGLFCAGALAASMSSGDAMAHAAASIAVRDGCVSALRLGWSEQRQRTFIRVAVVIVMLASYVLAVTYRGDLVSLLLWAYGPVGQFAPAVVATLYWHRATGAGVACGLLAGAVRVSVGSAAPWLLPWPSLHAGLYGLVAHIFCLVAVSLMTRPADDADYLKTAARIGRN